MQTRQTGRNRTQEFLLILIALVVLSVDLTSRNGFLVGWLQAQEGSTSAEASTLTEPVECAYFTNFAQYSASGPAILGRWRSPASTFSSAAGPRTKVVASSLAAVPDGTSITEVDGLTWIDDYVFSALSAQGIEPANLTNDAEFLRRVTLDLTGRIPAGGDVIAFLADPDPLKRTRAIDWLLDSPE